MNYDIYGIGNALVDKEFEVTEAFLQQQGIEKGLMTLTDEDRHHQLLDQLKTQFSLKKRASGGSGANSIVAASQLGGKTFYACKVANDEFGEFYMNDMHAAGVSTMLEQVRNGSNGVTGKCMVMVTPDAERTMNTFLGITTNMSPEDVYLEPLKQSQYLYIEGYLVTSERSRQAVARAREIAAEHGVKTALTFSDPSMATYFRTGLDEFIGHGVDMLFCNEEEALTFTETDDLADAINILKKKTNKLVLTLGSKGAMVINANEQTAIAPHPVKAIDTNGAGDMFAGAFLYGITQGMDDVKAGELASKAASKIVTVFGARLTKEDHQALLRSL